MRLNDRLSPHFTAWEATFSRTAIGRGIVNEPDDATWEKIRATAVHVLEPARLELGALRASSWYRCPELNELVGSKPTSQHLKGEAVDVIPLVKGVTIVDLFAWFHDNAPFDQLIYEFASWAHVSYVSDRPPRRSVLVATHGADGKVVYAPVTPEQLRQLQARI